MKDWIESYFFFPDKNMEHFPTFTSFENIYIRNKHKYESYHGWYIPNHLPNHNQKLIFYSHGNAGNISHRIPFIKKFFQQGFSIFIYDYPGFGNSDGYPSQSNCFDCASRFIRFLKKKKHISFDNIILFGESIGGFFSSLLAHHYQIPHLILQSTFTDIKDIISLRFSFIPSYLIQFIDFNNLSLLQSRKNNHSEHSFKTMIIHSQEDEIIPYQHALILSQFCDLFYTCQGKHSSFIMNQEYFENINIFLNIQS